MNDRNIQEAHAVRIFARAGVRITVLELHLALHDDLSRRTGAGRAAALAAATLDVFAKPAFLPAPDPHPPLRSHSAPR